MSGKRLIGTFRATDVRWSKKHHTITDVVIKPQSPPLYILDDDETTAYTKNQLQVVEKNELGPDEKAIARVGKNKGVKTYNVEDIMGSKMVNGKKYYFVKWIGFAKPTYEPAKTIKEDVPELVKAYEASLRG